MAAIKYMRLVAVGIEVFRKGLESSSPSVDTATLNADPPPPPSGHMQCVFYCTSNYIAGGQSHDIFYLKLSRMVGAGARVRTIGRNLQVAEVEVDFVTTTSNLGIP